MHHCRLVALFSPDDFADGCNLGDDSSAELITIVARLEEVVGCGLWFVAYAACSLSSPAKSSPPPKLTKAHESMEVSPTAPRSTTRCWTPSKKNPSCIVGVLRVHVK